MSADKELALALLGPKEPFKCSMCGWKGVLTEVTEELGCPKCGSTEIRSPAAKLN